MRAIDNRHGYLRTQVSRSPMAGIRTSDLSNSTPHASVGRPLLADHTAPMSPQAQERALQVTGLHPTRFASLPCCYLDR